MGNGKPGQNWDDLRYSSGRHTDEYAFNSSRAAGHGTHDSGAPHSGAGNELNGRLFHKSNTGYELTRANGLLPGPKRSRVPTSRWITSFRRQTPGEPKQFCQLHEHFNGEFPPPPVGISANIPNHCNIVALHLHDIRQISRPHRSPELSMRRRRSSLLQLCTKTVGRYLRRPSRCQRVISALDQSGPMLPLSPGRKSSG
jgi:hypothetical protein